MAQPYYQKFAYGIVANVVSERVLRTGAKVWCLRCNGDACHPVVRGLSKSGHLTEKYTHFKRLTNFRAAWIPEHMRKNHLFGYQDAFEDRASAEARAAWMNEFWGGVRFFRPDGQLGREGVGVTARFKEYRDR